MKYQPPRQWLTKIKNLKTGKLILKKYTFTIIKTVSVGSSLLYYADIDRKRRISYIFRYLSNLMENYIPWPIILIMQTKELILTIVSKIIILIDWIISLLFLGNSLA